jgi:hypothetical protein
MAPSPWIEFFTRLYRILDEIDARKAAKQAEQGANPLRVEDDDTENRRAGTGNNAGVTGGPSRLQAA